MYKNIILTGVPRSGSSLSCSLLNSYDNTLALLEPMKVFESDPKYGSIQACRDVDDFFFESRKKVLYESKVISGTINGEIATNTFESKKNTALRKAVIKNSELILDRTLSKDFTLILKHPAFFTAILKDLTNFFECYATIRNPLSILASWQTIDVPINRGHIPAAERFDQKLKQKLESTEDRLDRQLIILDWFFSRYEIYLPSKNIIYYEEIISTNGEVFSPLSFNGKREDRVKLENKNTNSQYADVDIELLYSKLIASNGSYWNFYKQKDIDIIFSFYN